MRKKREKYRNFRHPAWGYTLVFVVSLAVFGYIQGTRPQFEDPDSFYHAKMGLLMREQGPILDFPWLPFTTLAENYADHHLVYHLALIPFQALFGPLVGMKVVTVFFGALVILVFCWLLRAHGVRGAPAFSLLLLGASNFLFRMSLAKASSVSLIFLFLTVIAIHKRRYGLLFLLAFLYVWSYGGWPLMIPIVLVFLISRYVIRKLSGEISVSRTRRRFIKNVMALPESRGVFSVLAGLATGLVVNPYFPQNLKFYWEQIVQVGLVNYQGDIGVGAEWYPHSLPSVFLENGTPFILFLLTAAVMAVLLVWPDTMRESRKKIPSDTLVPIFSALLIASLFLLMSLRNQRHIEYFVPFLMMFDVLLMSLLLSRLRVAKLFSRLTDLFGHRRIAYAIVILLVSLLPIVAVKDVVVVRRAFSDRNTIPWTKYSAASTWLSEYTSSNSVIVHSDWDEFPSLFYHNDRNAYIAGLDPTFFFRMNPELFEEWRGLRTGEVQEPVSEMLLEKFGSVTILIDKDYNKMRDVMENDPDVYLTYEDEEVWIYSAL